VAFTKSLGKKPGELTPSRRYCRQC